MNFQEIYNELRGYLQLTLKITDKVGADINVGEKFTVLVIVRNIAPQRTCGPKVVFTDPVVQVVGSVYATPVEGDKTYRLQRTTLNAGDSDHIEVVFKALRTVPAVFEGRFYEHITNVWVHSKLDMKQLSEICKLEQLFGDIDRT